MIKKIAIVLSILTLCTLGVYADIEAGVSVNYRGISASSVKDTYGTGITFAPVLEMQIVKGLYIGASYEFGYKKDANIGIKNEKSTLKIYGGEAFLTYRFGKGSIVPYIKAGAGRYTYKQEIESSALKDPSVTQSKTVWVAGGGLKFYIGKSFFVNAEFRYSPFEVDGAGSKKLDIGGIKAGVGVGIVL